ncbi:MAG: S9 family peptidase [Phycisphaerales bacterium]|nr:S9 family peptidase [Phycisphaerales bacterium]
MNNTPGMRVRRSIVAALALTFGAGAMAQITTSPDRQPRPATAPAAKGPGKLIPRAVLFGNPEKAGATISPDGSKVAFLAPVDGVMNVWVATTGRLADAKPVTKETRRGIRMYSWAHTSKHILYRQDQNGDENWHIYGVDLDANKTTDLTPLPKVAARIAHESDKFPDEIVIAINDRDPAYHDLYRVNIRTGDRKLLQQSDGFVDFEIDDDYRVRYAYKPAADGGSDEYKAVEKDGKVAFEKSDSISLADAGLTGGVGFDKTGNVRYMRDSRGRDKAGLFAVDTTNGSKKLLFEDDRVDAGQPLIHPTTKEVQAVEFNYDKSRWALIDRALEKDWQFIRKKGGDGDLFVASRSRDDRYWIVNLAPDNASGKAYLYDRGVEGDKPVEPSLTMLFESRPALREYSLAKMEPTPIKSRDGNQMMSYLTLPPGSDLNGDKMPDKPVPMVLYVHGGPWARDNWGFNPIHQWLANRGYAVLSVNYRGSTGFGKGYIMASRREWGGKMHDDLIDAVNWAVTKKVADPARVAIFGGSYGGYATLVGLTFTPDVFACGVDIVGVSNLPTFMQTIPPYWKPEMERWRQLVGDDTTEEGRAFLLSRSPVSKVDQIKKPLLIGQGANDPRVVKAESDQMVSAMKAKHIPVTYVVYPDEGHGFARPQNRTSFNAIAEVFLATHLGKNDPGVRFEPIGAAFKDSSLVIEEGIDQVPGLSEAKSSAK